LKKTAIESALDRLAGRARSGRAPHLVIAGINRDLARLNLGVEVYLADTPFSDGAWMLGYARLLGPGWCLVACPPMHERPPQPLADLPPADQQAALALLPRLLDELGHHVRVAIRGVEWARLIPGALPRLAREARRTRRPHAPR